MESFLSLCVPRREGRKGGEQRERRREGKGREEEKKKRRRMLSHHACKNSQLTYHMCSLIVLPSSSIVLTFKSIPGETEGEDGRKWDRRGGGRRGRGRIGREEGEEGRRKEE